MKYKKREKLYKRRKIKKFQNREVKNDLLKNKGSSGVKVRLITIKRPVEISSRKFLLKLFRIIELYRKIILLKQNIVNTKKSHKLIFLRNVKTTLLSFEGVKVLIIVIRRTFTSLEPLFFKKSFFSSLF